MANSPTYRVKLRRRREGKTNYYKRRDMLKSGLNRVIIRRTTKNMLVQFVESQADGDKTNANAISPQLEAFGWKLSGGNIPAAYLTGYLAGKRAIKAGVETAILDLGLQRNTKGGRIYAALKGVIDSGIEINANESIFPENDIIEGTHIQKAAKAIEGEDKDTFKKLFDRYTKAKVKVDKLPDLVNKVKGAIDKE